MRLDLAPKLKHEKAKQLRIVFAEPGDVILTHNATVGRVAILPSGAPKIVLSTSTTYYRVDKKILLSEFLAYVLRSHYFQSQLEAIMEQTTRNQVSVTKQVELGIQVAPVLEQKEIVGRLKALFRFADQIEARYQNAHIQVDKLTQSILAEAFRGELVPTEAELARREGRDYEPASALLDRILKDRALTVGRTEMRRVARRSKRK